MEVHKLIELVQSGGAGNKEAFVELIDFYRQSMYATALAVTHNEQDALDAIQDTILILWEKLSSLRNPKYFKTWMTKILVNRCCAMKRQCLRESPAAYLPEEGQEQERETALDVSRTLQRLSTDDRFILQLFYYEDLSVRQIAQVLSATPGAVKMRLTRSRKKFLNEYGAEVQYEKR